MTQIVAALGADACAAPVLAAAKALAEMLDAAVVALHVGDGGAPGLEALANAARVEFRQARGAPLERIVSATNEADVVALVLGSRGASAGPRPAGATALEVITRTAKPVVLVPPDARPPERFTRLLLPIEGTGEVPPGARRHHPCRPRPQAGGRRAASAFPGDRAGVLRSRASRHTGMGSGVPRPASRVRAGPGEGPAPRRRPRGRCSHGCRDDRSGVDRPRLAAEPRQGARPVS